MPESDERISTVVKRCFSLFKAAVALDHAPSGIQTTDNAGTQLSDQRGRFKIWSANIGAHQPGASSLDYKLRDASRIRRQVLEILHDLAELLENYMALVKGEMVPWDELPADESEEVHDEEPTTELRQIIFFCKDALDDLLNLSSIMSNPTPHDRFRAAASANVSFYEMYDFNHVRELYSSLSSWQIERLAKAITRRRQYFRYRQAHHEKLAFGVDDDYDSDGLGNAPSTLATSIPNELKTEGPSSSLDDRDTEQDEMSRTSFATSAGQDDARRIPPMPEEAEHGPFECQFCCYIIVAQNRTEWKRHVFEDLRPYVCLQDVACDDANEFIHRRDWINHIHKSHWIEYSCPSESCAQKFSRSSDFEAHVKARHVNDKSKYGMSTLVNLARVEKIDEGNLTCPFCREAQKSVKAHHRHVGRHMEALSLFALPLTEDEDHDENSSSSEKEDENEEAASTQEHGHEQDDEASATWRMMPKSADPGNLEHEARMAAMAKAQRLPGETPPEAPRRRFMCVAVTDADDPPQIAELE